MAAGAWLSSAGYGDVLSATATKSLQLAVQASAKAQDLVLSPAFRGFLARDTGIGALRGAVAEYVGVLTLGAGSLSAAGEGTTNAATNWASTPQTITPARFDLVRSVSDYGADLLAGFTITNGDGLTPDVIDILVRDGYAAWATTYCSTMLADTSSLSVTAGTTGTALTWQTCYNAALAGKNRGNRGPATMVLSLKGCTDLANDALSLGGAVQMSQQVQRFLDQAPNTALVAAGLFGFVDLYMADNCDTSAGDTYGAMLWDGVWGSKHASPPFLPGAHMVYDLGFIRCEAVRAAGATTTFSHDCYFGMHELDDNAGTRLIYSTT